MSELRPETDCSRAPTRTNVTFDQPISQPVEFNQSQLRLSITCLTYHTCPMCPNLPNNIWPKTMFLDPGLPGPISTATWTSNVSNQNQPTPTLYLAARRIFGWCTTITFAITIGWKHYATTNIKIEIYVWYKCCEFFSFSYLVTLCLVGQATAINVLLNTARKHIWVAVGFFVEKSLTGGLHY